jgi:thiamine biosynthesis lipoprotein
MYGLFFNLQEVRGFFLFFFVNLLPQTTRKMKRLIPVLALLAAGCSEPNYETFSGFAQGTTYSIVVKNPAPGVAGKIDAVFEEIDATFSVFNPASLASRINRNETDAVTPLFEECFVMANKVSAATEGYFDSTVGPLVDAWGFGPGEQQAAPNVDSLMEFTGMDKVRIDGGHIIKDDGRVQLNFSSIAKGLTVDKLAEMLDAEGATDYMVEVGGEVRVTGRNEKAGRAWQIQLDKPVFGMARAREAIVPLGGGARASIATSGNYRNWFTDESGRMRAHTIDPKTGYPALGEILSVSIVAAECAPADAWATGVMASGTVENARRLLDGAPAGLEYYIIYGTADSPAAFHSTGFPLAAAKK